MAETTEVVCTAAFVYLPDLVAAARIAASQAPLPQTTAFQITYRAKEGNASPIEFSTEPDFVSRRLLAEESFEEFYDNQASLRNWFVRGDGQSLIVTLQS